MGKCKKKNCNKEVEEGKKYCKFHQAKREDNAKKLIGLGTTVGGIVLFKMIKK